MRPPFAPFSVVVAFHSDDGSRAGVETGAHLISAA
jgi:hypothetical protein